MVFTQSATVATSTDRVGATVPLSTAGITFRVVHDEGTTVVALDGVACADEDPGLLSLPAASGGAATIVDLSGLMLVDSHVVQRLLHTLCRPDAKVKLVCRRTSARHLLRAWRLDDHFDIFSSIDMALHQPGCSPPSRGT